MIDALMKLTKQNSNMFWAKPGVYSNFSPNALLQKPTINCNKDLQYMFGEFVEAHLDCSNTNDTIECTLDMIYLCPSKQHSVSHVVMNLNTGKCLKCLHLTSFRFQRFVQRNDA